MTRPWSGYRATPKLERELARRGMISFADGPYKASAISVGLNYFEAYTDSMPFIYGRPAGTLQGALDNLEAAVRANIERRSSEIEKAR